MSSGKVVPPRPLSPAINLVVVKANGMMVRIFHHTTRHRRAEQFENPIAEVRSSVVGQVDNVGKYLFRHGGGTEERGLEEAHQSGDSIVVVSCEKIIKG